MTPPPRLLESSQNSAAVDLLRAGLRERPRQGARQAAALAVGVSSTVVAASTTATAAAGTVTALATPSAGMVLAKWVAVGTLGGLGLASTASVVSEVAGPRATAATAPSVRHAGAVQRAVESAAPKLAHATDGEVSQLRSESPKLSSQVAVAKARPLDVAKVLTTAEAPAKPTPPASASLPAAPSLSREIALIDGARRSLVSGDSSGALKMLDDYAALLRTGTFDREAQLLRIDALSQAGQRAVALSLAARYLESHPNDPHAPRLRALLVAP